MRTPLDLDKTSAKTRRDFTLARGVAISGKFVDEKGKDWQIGESNGNAMVIKDKPDKSDFSNFSLTHFGNKYRPENVAMAAGGSFALGEGGYCYGDMHFPTKSTFLIQGMMRGNTMIGFAPSKERQKVVKILLDGRNIMESGIETKPGQEIKDVTIVIGTATKEGSRTESKPAPAPAVTTESNTGQAKTIAEIEKLGGKVTLDEKDPGRLFVNLGRADAKVIDALVEDLHGLTTLRTLSLTLAEVTDDAELEHLNRPPTLQTLNLILHNVTDAGLKQVKGLTKLRMLHVAHTQVTDAGLVHLKGLIQLQELHLEFTAITDAGLKQLKELTQLQTLGLTGTEVTDAGLEQLQGLTELRNVRLDLTKISDAGLKRLTRLTQLQGLNLDFTAITDAGLKQLKGMTQLQTLNLRGTQVTDSGVKKLQQALPNCKIDYKPADEHPAPRRRRRQRPRRTILPARLRRKSRRARKSRPRRLPTRAG